MNKKLLVASLFAFVTAGAMAQSAFEGFYGQIATGYESNSFGSGNGAIDSPSSGENYPLNSPSQQFGGVPLVIGLGYNYSVAPKWLIGIGVDYSALSQKSSTFNTNMDTSSVGLPSFANFPGSSMQVSNRFNIFISPGYEIDIDKLLYLKAGYSSVSAKLNGPSSYVVSIPGVDAISINPNMGSSTVTVGGYVVGLGYKQIITDGLYGFAEINYMSYSKPSFSYSGVINTLPTTSTISASLNSYQALVGVGYKF